MIIELEGKLIVLPSLWSEDMDIKTIEDFFKKKIVKRVHFD